MRVLWVNPSFLDYRVALYQALDQCLDGNLYVVFSGCRVEERVQRRLFNALGDRAVCLLHERMLRVGRLLDEEIANAGLIVPWQAGLLSAIRNAAPDVIVAEGFFQWTPAALVYARGTRTPVVLSYERTRHTERACPWWRRAYRRAMSRQFEAAVCPGVLSRAYLLTLGFRPSQLVTGAMAADSMVMRERVARADPDRRLEASWPDAWRRPRFLFVGRLISRKGVKELVREWEVYKDAGGSGCLLVAGRGPEAGVVTQAISRRSDLHLRWVNHIDYEDVYQYYAFSDVLVMPTLEDNWSLVVPEAMACGCAILCSRFNGCWPELVKPGVNGWVFDPTVVGELASLMRQAERAQLDYMKCASQRIEAAYGPVPAAAAVRRACELALQPRRRGS